MVLADAALIVRSWQISHLLEILGFAQLHARNTDTKSNLSTG
ncbi:hypothetical protein ACQ4M3_41980 [Leptolyngbya sp. AN03gr2]